MEAKQLEVIPPRVMARGAEQAIEKRVQQELGKASKKALVVDVPMPTMEALAAQRSAEIQAAMRRAEEERALEHSRRQLCPSQCTHVRANGLRCGRPAAPGMDECEWHFEWYSRFPSLTQMPYPEDGISIQHVLARTAAMVLNREITPAHARAMARLCREMRANLGRFDWEMARAEWVKS
jgi:hypothetical protein